MGTDGKVYVNADELLLDSFRLAKKIFLSDWRPDFLLAIWRGGAPVGMAVHEFFVWQGIKLHHTVIKSTSYEGIGQRREVQFEYADQIWSAIKPDMRVLVVDDVFDSGSTVAAILRQLQGRAAEVRVATVYWKPNKNVTTLRPDYHLRETDEWVVFPHELNGLTVAELKIKSEPLNKILNIASGN